MIKFEQQKKLKNNFVRTIFGYGWVVFVFAITYDDDNDDP